MRFTHHPAPRFPRKKPRRNHASASRFTAALLLAAAPSLVFAQTSLSTLRQNFQNPPDNARPMVRWWWFGTAVEKPEILRELQQMKADGIGGCELAFVYPEVLDDPAKGLINEPFVGPAMLDNVRYAQAEARKLGLRVDVTLGSGWPYGGPATTLEEAATRLRAFEVPLPANASSAAAPKLEEGDSIISVALVNGEPKHWDASTAKSIDPKKISSIAPESQPRVALFFVQSHTRQIVKRAAVGAEGWVLDPFSHQAVATHLKSIGEPLVKAFGDTPPYAIFSDSLEAYGADWTPNMLQEFRKRRGYDLLPHLPELVAGDTPQAETIRHDWGKTLTEMVNENYLTQINSWAIAHHTKFRSQTYGEPAVNLSSERLAALPEGEGPQWRAFSTLRWATSANHVFGNNVTSGETFTWLHSPVFRATPLDMKAEADIDFITGENQLIFHGWPYSPPPSSDGQPKVPEPGWSLYAAASFNNHNPWHPVMPSVTRYISRMSYLLRQGQPANQVAILLPTDDAWADFNLAHVTVTGVMAHLITPAIMSSILSSGFNIDFIDADAINSVGLGTHQIVVIPQTDRIPVETLRKLHAFSEKGGKVISIGHTPTMDPEGKPSAEITELTKAIPVVPDPAQLAKALAEDNPDLKLSGADDNTKAAIGFIRRKLPTADIYFLTNTSNEPVEAHAAFGTVYKTGEQWNFATDNPTPTAASPTDVTLHLAPYESRVFLFSASSAPASATQPARQLADLSDNWKVSFTGINKTETEKTLTDWTADPSTLHFSGEAVYTRDLDLTTTPGSPVSLEVEGGKAIPGSPSSPPEHAALGPNGLPDPHVTRVGPGMHAWYDPPIHEAANVLINGQYAGALWHPPYRVDVSKLLKPGHNTIEIRVYNTALNAWSALPPHDYKPLIAKYGDRFQMQDLDKVKPIPSGILGPIRLVTGEEQ